MSKRPYKFVSLAAVGAVACLVLFAVVMDWRTSPKPPAAFELVGGMKYAGDAGAADLPQTMLLGATSASELMLIHPGDAALAAEPAGLAPLPGARRLSGFRRQAGGVVEDVAFWQAAGASIDAVWEHYLAAASVAGFSPLVPDDSRARSRSRLFVRGDEPADRQSLVVRLTPDDGQIRIMIWARHPRNLPTSTATSTQP